jgi:hypothetical protein
MTDATSGRCDRERTYQWANLSGSDSHLFFLLPDKGETGRTNDIRELSLAVIQKCRYIALSDRGDDASGELAFDRSISGLATFFCPAAACWPRQTFAIQALRRLERLDWPVLLMTFSQLARAT